MKPGDTFHPQDKTQEGDGPSQGSTDNTTPSTPPIIDDNGDSTSIDTGEDTKAESEAGSTTKAPEAKTPAEPVAAPESSASSPPESAPVEEPLADSAGDPAKEQSAKTDSPSDDETPPPTTPTDDPEAPSPQNDPPAPQPPDTIKKTSDSEVFNWQSSEYIHHHKTPLWFMGLALATLVFVAFFVLVLHEILSVIVIVLMALAVAFYGYRKPGTIDYELSGNGIKIVDRFYPFSQFRGFALVPDKAFTTIELDPLKRFAPRISLFYPHEDEAKILGILEAKLPRADREAAPIDKLARTLKF